MNDPIHGGKSVIEIHEGLGIEPVEVNTDE